MTVHVVEKRYFLLLSVFHLISCLCILPVAAEDKPLRYGSVNELIAAVTRQAATARNLSCDVVQEKHLSMLSGPVIFTGRMIVQRPDRLRWEFISPIPSVFIINGSRVIRCVQGAAPMEIDINSSPALKQAAAQMLAWVSGDLAGLRGMFHIRLAPKGVGIVLEPKKPGVSAGISRITILFDAFTLRPRTVRIDEQGGDWTRIIMSNYHINSVLPDGMFQGCR